MSHLIFIIYQVLNRKLIQGKCLSSKFWCSFFCKYDHIGMWCLFYLCLCLLYLSQIFKTCADKFVLHRQAELLYSLDQTPSVLQEIRDEFNISSIWKVTLRMRMVLRISSIILDSFLCLWDNWLTLFFIMLLFTQDYPHEQATFIVSKSFFDNEEYDRAAHYTSHCKSPLASFLRNYSIYLSGEKKRMDNEARQLFCFYTSVNGQILISWYERTPFSCQ